jgi:uncharacterized RDD family membrane protein YckC
VTERRAVQSRRLAAKWGKPKIASLARRFIGAVIDSFLTLVLFGVLLRHVVARGQPMPSARYSLRWLGVVESLGALYVIVPTALWGWTLGKRVVGTRVSVDQHVPGWWRSCIRWAVAFGPSVLVAPWHAQGWARVLATVVWPFAVYVGILTDPLRRGLHDRAAGTVVVAVN